MARRAALAAPLVVLFIAAAGSAAEQEFTSAGLLLAESLGARGSAMGDAGVAVTGDLGGTSYNPATLAHLERREFLARFQSSLGEVRTAHLAYGRGGTRGGWFAQAAAMDAGKIDLSLGGVRSSRSAQRDYVGGLGAAVRMGAMSLGATAKFIQSTLVEDFTASSVAGDAGLLVRLPRGVTFGAAVQNAGSELKYRDAGDPLPLTTRAGLAWSFTPEKGASRTDLDDVDSGAEKNIITLAAEAVRGRDGVTVGNAGFEWTNWPRASLRAGYSFGDDAAAAFGIGFLVGAYALDYSIRLVDEVKDVHRVALSMHWGDAS